MNVKKATQQTQETQQVSNPEVIQQVQTQEPIQQVQQEEITQPQLEESTTPSKQSSDSKKPSSFGFLKNKQTKVNEPSSDTYQEPVAFVEQPKKVWGYVEEPETQYQSEVPNYQDTEQAPIYQYTTDAEQQQITYEENPPNVWGSQQESSTEKPKQKRPWRQKQQDSQQNSAQQLKPTSYDQSPTDTQQQPEQQFTYQQEVQYQQEYNYLQQPETHQQHQIQQQDQITYQPPAYYQENEEPKIEEQLQNEPQSQQVFSEEKNQTEEIDKFEIFKDYLESNLKELDKQLQNHLSNFQIQLLEIFNQEISLEQEQEQNSKLLEQLQYKISQLNGQLQAAVELEQFQKADDIQGEQDELNNQINELKQKIEQGHQEIEKLSKQRWELKTSSAQYYEELNIKLSSEEGNHKQVIEEFNTENNQEIEKLEKTINDERYTLKNKHQEVDQHFQDLDQEQEKLNQEIKTKTQEFEDQRVSLEEQQKTSIDEINELKRLLQEKEKNLQEIQKDLKNVVKKISETKKSIDQKIDQIIDEKVTLQDELQQIENDKLKVDVFEQKVHQKQKEYQAKQELLLNIFNSISKFNTKIEEEKNIISEDINQEKSFYEIIKSAKEISHNSYLKLKEAESGRDGLISKRTMIEETQGEMLAEQKQLNEKLPQLLSEKNSHILSKNYKGAQVVTNQIKQAQQQIEVVEQNLKISGEKIEEVNQEIEQNQNIVEQMKQQYLENQGHYEKEKKLLLELRLRNLQGIEQKNLSKPLSGLYEKNIEFIQQELKQISERFSQS